MYLELKNTLILSLLLTLTACNKEDDDISACINPTTEYENLQTSKASTRTFLGGKELICGYYSPASFKHKPAKVFFVPNDCPAGGRAPQDCLPNQVGSANSGYNSQTSLTPRIYLNKDLLEDLPEKYQQFWFWHECVHIQKNHGSPFSFSENKENIADCEGVKLTKKLCGLKKNELEEFEPHMARLVTDSEHPSGEVRYNNITRCYNEN